MALLYWEDNYNKGSIESFEITEKPVFKFTYSFIYVDDDKAIYAASKDSENTEIPDEHISEVLMFANNTYEKLNHEWTTAVQAEATAREAEMAEKQAEQDAIEAQIAADAAARNTEPMKTNISSREALIEGDWLVIRELERMFLKDTPLNVTREALRDSIVDQ